jgi:hypothetical protein
MTLEVSWAAAVRAQLGAQVADLDDPRLEAVARATLQALRDWLDAQPQDDAGPPRPLEPLGILRARGKGPRGNARWVLHLPAAASARVSAGHAAPVPAPSPASAQAPQSVAQQAWITACQQGDPPLIDPDRRLMLVFSPKAACSSSVIWFFHQAGLAQEARAHHEWPHRYRIERYSAGERQARGWLLPPQDLRVVRVVRDPLDRAASSFRHALGTGYASERILAAVGVDTRTEPLSFQRFIDFLETEDLDRCDPHHRRQRHPVEDLRAPDVVISTTEHDLFAGLNAAERRFGLPVTDFGSLAWVHDVQRHRVPRSVDMGERPDLVPLTTRQALSGPWPTGLLTPLARERLIRLYADDVARYTGLPDPAALG